MLVVESKSPFLNKLRCVSARGPLAKYAPVAQTVDGGTGTNDNIDIESAVRRELERTTNGVESLEATRFFEDIVESQRKQVGLNPPSPVAAPHATQLTSVLSPCAGGDHETNARRNAKNAV